MINANEVISHLEQLGTWVNWDKTRDVVLFNESDKMIERIGVCWILTDKALDQAIANDIKFIVTHENCFYFESTHQYRLLLESRRRKQKRLEENNITVYRSHDVWDYVAEEGNIDSFKTALGYQFEKRQTNEKYSVAYLSDQSVKDVAKKVAQVLSEHGQDHCDVLGDLDKKINGFALGIGAACNLFDMLKYPNVNCVLVSDDGACNWVDHQYCLDNDIAIIIVHHSCNEVLGMKSMAKYLKRHFSELDVHYLKEGFRYQTITANKE